MLLSPSASCLSLKLEVAFSLVCFIAPETFFVEGMHGISDGGVHVPGGCHWRISLKASNLVMLAAILSAQSLFQLCLQRHMCSKMRDASSNGKGHPQSHKAQINKGNIFTKKTQTCTKKFPPCGVTKQHEVAAHKAHSTMFLESPQDTMDIPTQSKMAQLLEDAKVWHETICK